MSDDRKLNRHLLAAAFREHGMMAEELHDTVCQSLAGASLLVGLLLRRTEAGEKIEPFEISRIRDCLEEAIEHAAAPFRAEAILAQETGLLKALENLAKLTDKRLVAPFLLRPKSESPSRSLPRFSIGWHGRPFERSFPPWEPGRSSSFFRSAAG